MEQQKKRVRRSRTGHNPIPVGQKLGVTRDDNKVRRDLLGVRLTQVVFILFPSLLGGEDKVGEIRAGWASGRLTHPKVKHHSHFIWDETSVSQR